MTARAAHEHEAEIERLIDNWARWPGWTGGTSSRSSVAWIMDFVSRRQSLQGASVPVMGGEAADTQAALMRMQPHLQEAIVAYYTCSGDLHARLFAFNYRKRGKNRIGERAFRYRVAAAREEFWMYWTLVRSRARHVGDRNRATNPGLAGVRPEVPRPREVLVSSPWVGVDPAAKPA
jgi:hypothetical protein